MKNYTYDRRKLFFLFFILLQPLHFLSAQQVAKSLTASNGVAIGFYEYKPTDYNANPATKYPLIIFLHGIGERGNGTTQLPLVLANGIPNNINNGHPMRFFWNGKWQTFLVLSPQLSNNYGWWQQFYIDEMIKYAKQNLQVDTNRIILTGLSLGGGGVWDYANSTLANAQKFSAIGVSCGTCQSGNWCNIASANLPTWAFHAQDDGTVSVGCTTGSIAAINNCNPAVKPYMTIWPDGQHWIWGRVFDTAYAWQNPNIYEWFLGQDKSLPVNVRPVANAGANKSITNSTGQVTLDASGSYDTDGNIVRYIWRKVTGPSFGNITTPVSANGITTVMGLVMAGTYVFEVKVVDDRADWTFATVTITVTNGPPLPNQAPVAKAGADITITLPISSTTLQGSSSYDPDGYIATYSWTKIAGPAPYNIANTADSTTAVSNLVQGTYTFVLTVTDNKNATGTDTINVIVNPAPVPPNQAPVAKTGADIIITLPVSSTTLQGGASYDPDGFIATYSWVKIAGPAPYNIANAADSTTALSNLVQGTYTLVLTVTDNKNATGTDTINVIVNPAPVPPNQAPVAKTGADIIITLPVSSTTLQGGASYDPDGFIATYSWTKIAGPAPYNIANAADSTTALSNLVQGTYTFVLTVTDNKNATGTDTINVIVNPAPVPPNQAPVAKTGADIIITLPVSSTTLQGGASYDPDGYIATYSWTKIAGPAQYNIANAADSTTALSNLVQGTYTFVLTVTDNKNTTGTDTVNITVNPAPAPPNQSPVAKAGADITITLPVSSTTLQGGSSYDPDGYIATYNWAKIAGPGQYNIANAADSTTALSNLVQGTYIFVLTVTDNNNATSTDTINVVVNPALAPPNQSPVAKAGADITITLPISSTTLQGGSSYDPDGYITTYSWAKIAGPAQYNIANAGDSTTTLSNLVQGTYTFVLTVTDNKNATSTDTVTVVVNPATVPPPPNKAPVAIAGNNQVVSLPNPVIQLDGSASYDPDGNIASYHWKLITGPNTPYIGYATAATTAITGVTTGDYTFELLVTDNNGATGTALVKITVLRAPNLAPVAVAGKDTGITLPASIAWLKGAGSYDPDGNIVTYTWRQVSGPSTARIGFTGSISTSASNLQAGDYVFELTVTDNEGATGRDSITISVTSNLRYREKLSVYPNPVAPSTNKIIIRNLSESIGQVYITIYDVNGKAVFTFTGIKAQSYSEIPVNVSTLQPGLYYIEVLMNNLQKNVVKLLRQ